MEQFEELMTKIDGALQLVEQNLEQITTNVKQIRQALEM